MPFEEAVEVVSSNLVTRVLVPTWARRLTAGLRRVDDACDDVMVCIALAQVLSDL